MSELILPQIIMTPECFSQARERSITDITIDDTAMDFIANRPGMPENAWPDITVLRAHSMRDPRIDKQHAAPYFSAHDLANEQPTTSYELAEVRAAAEAGKRVLQVTVVTWTEADLATEFVGNTYRERSNSEPLSFKGLGRTLIRLVNQNTDNTQPASNTAEEHRGTNINLARLYKPYRFTFADSAKAEQ